MDGPFRLSCLFFKIVNGTLLQLLNDGPEFLGMMYLVSRLHMHAGLQVNSL